jgi:two-component system, NarL family, sensor kinase
VTGAVVRFSLTGLLVLLLVGLGGVELLHRVARSQAISDATEMTRLGVAGLVAPVIDEPLLRGDPAAIARMDALLKRRLVRDPIVRVKLWDASGRIVYSDEPRLVGRRYAMPADEREILRTGGTKAELSDLTSPENRFERRYGKLMEVYHGVRGPRGERMLFEVYQRDSAVNASARERWLSFLPVLLGALGLIALLQVPIAVSLARRVRRAERDRAALLERAIDAQDQERRRIATDLHDGVVQTLAGVSFRLGAASAHADGDASPALTAALHAAARETRTSMRALRSLLVDIYPPSLQREGLVAALSDLTTRTAGPSLRVALEAPHDIQLPPATEALLFRAAQEALRNVVTHAAADSARVVLERSDGHVRLVVEDDGHGFSSEELRGRPINGHFGLRALEDLVHDGGGELRVDSAPRRGTRLTVRLPTP